MEANTKIARCRHQLLFYCMNYVMFVNVSLTLPQSIANQASHYTLHIIGINLIWFDSNRKYVETRPTMAWAGMRLFCSNNSNSHETIVLACHRTYKCGFFCVECVCEKCIIEWNVCIRNHIKCLWLFGTQNKAPRVASTNALFFSYSIANSYCRQSISHSYSSTWNLWVKARWRTTTEKWKKKKMESRAFIIRAQSIHCQQCDEWREQLIILSEYSVANSGGSSTGDAGDGVGKRQSSWRVLICKFIWQK